MTTPVLATRPVRFALRAALIASAEVAALVADRVYNAGAPQGAALPRIVMQSPTQRGDAAFGQSGASGEWMLHSWAETAAGAEQILGACVVALHERVLPVAGYAHVSGVVEVLDLMRDPDSVTPLYHGVASYRWTALANKEG